MSRKKQFIKNAVMLTAVSLMMRAVSFSFNVYVANKIGASGMGIFALIMSLYNFGVTFASSGISLASTKIVAEETAKGKSKKAALKKCILYSVFFGVLAFLLIFFSSAFFADKIVNDRQILLPLKILSVSLPCVAMSFALSGYFIATGKAYKNSIVQITEQGVKILSAVILLNSLDIIQTQSACICLVLSGTISEIFSFLLLAFVCWMDIKKERLAPSPHLTRRIVKYGLPVALSSYLRALLNTAENTLIPKSLEKFSGIKEKALSDYGIVHGMVMPMVFLPSGVISSVSTLLIPEIAILKSHHNYKKIDTLIERVLSLTLAFSIGSAGFMYFFSDTLAFLFYKNTQVAYFLKLVAPLVAIMYTDGVIDAVLKGLNQEVHAMRYDIILSFVSIFLICTLIPAKGISGYIIIIYISEMMNAYLSINRLMEVSAFDIHPFIWTLVPALAIFSSCFFAKSILTGVPALMLSLFFYSLIIILYLGKERTLQRHKFVIKYD